jgi:hypothetical protein
MKIHTSNVEKVRNMLESSGLKYRYEENYHKFLDLSSEYYFNMPELKWSEDLLNRKVFDVETSNDDIKKVVCELFGVKPTKNNYLYYELEQDPNKYEYQFTHRIKPTYPIYVITKGRWELTYTINTLEEMQLDFFICVEPSEYQNYIQNPKVDKNKILLLPENFSERNCGSIPVRNFVWEHSVSNGNTRHWILDDNIDCFYRWNDGKKLKVKDGVVFKVMEDYMDRYENIGLVSCQYKSFVPAIDTSRTQIIINTRAYSCILINTELLDKRLEERWRGRYNEDTDLSLRVLSTGDLCTVNFNTILSGKMPTGSMKGGNDKIYMDHTNTGYQKKYDELKENWGDIVSLSTNRHKDKRPHHIIEYTKLFKQKLKLKEGVERHPIINNYNMMLVKKLKK